MPRLSRRAFSALAVAFGLCGARVRGQTDSDDASGPYEVILESNRRVAMRDGVHLATDVYRPARDGRPAPGRFAAILERTPYGRNVTYFRDITAANPVPRTRAEVAAYYVRRGYVVILQDCRGRHDSEGEFVKYLNEGRDGYDTCRWLVEQPWSSGVFGTMGLSYAAHAQVALACLNPPGLKAMYIDCGGFSNAYQGGIRQGGAFELKQVTWAYSLGLESPEVQRDPRRLAALKAVDLKAWFARMPWRRGSSPLSLIPDYESYVFEQWEHGRFDAYWKQLGIYAAGYYGQFANAPWSTCRAGTIAYARTATENYVGLSRRKRAPVQLIMGPWTHGDRSATFAGDVDFGPACNARRQRRRHLCAAARVVRPLAEGQRATARGDRRRCGCSSWAAAAAAGLLPAGWIMADTGAASATGRSRTAGSRPYYLLADGRLAPRRRPGQAPRAAYDFDPRHPVPTIGGTITSGEPVMRGGGLRPARGPEVLRLAASRTGRCRRGPDVLVFQTEPLAADIEVTGAIEAKLWISSDRRRHRFHHQADRCLSAEQGLSGRLRVSTSPTASCAARYRDSWEKPTLTARRASVAGSGHRLSDRQHLRARSSHPSRCLLEQLPALRPESQHRRAGRQGPYAARRAQQLYMDARTPLARGAARHSEARLRWHPGDSRASAP